MHYLKALILLLLLTVEVKAQDHPYKGGDFAVHVDDRNMTIYVKQPPSYNPHGTATPEYQFSVNYTWRIVARGGVVEVTTYEDRISIMLPADWEQVGIIMIVNSRNLIRREVISYVAKTLSYANRDRDTR